MNSLKQDLINFLTAYDNLWYNERLPQDIAQIIHIDTTKIKRLIDKLED